MPYYFYGTNYSETLRGTNYADVIYGYGGHDWLFGYAGNDWLDGGSGDDYLDGGSGHDTLIGGTGYNDYWGGYGADRFVQSARGSAGFSNDAILDFNPDLDGDKIDVSAWGVSDFSQIRALLRSDSYGDATLNAFYGGYNHVLTIEQFAPADLISSDFIFRNDTAPRSQTGTAYADVLFGSRFGETLSGRNGNDTLLGGGGDDILIGGLGKDTLWGGTGYDDFAFDFASETPAGAGRDVIRDFVRGYDLIDLEHIDPSSTAGDQDFTFRGSGAFTGDDQVRYYHTAAGNTIIQGNTDGSTAEARSSVEFEIEVTGRHYFTASDFDL